ncbi:hypothetical protein HAZT_HAZT000710 [Hyalella azteca]|uniref:cellulase n=1 Tax=Hyalella azteca TaxID=294128 RepID=A0A6A0HHW5_HYAAZ|nr:hypothetical protein HAZT_HAZT000710 [Hyalella azteca]
MAEEFGGQYTSALQSFMNDIRGFPTTPGGMVFIDQWGSLRQALNVAFIGFKAADLGIDSSTNRAWAARQVDYALGSVGHSYVVGFGNNPPLRPHHRSRWVAYTFNHTVTHLCDPTTAPGGLPVHSTIQ